MDNKTWKEDRDVLSEAYSKATIYEELDSAPAPGPVDVVASPEEELDIAIEPGVEPVEEPMVDTSAVPQEAQALLDELESPSFDLQQLAQERRLSEYIAFLNTLLKGAEEFNNLKKPPEAE